jgi:hypothetical protein
MMVINEHVLMVTDPSSSHMHASTVTSIGDSTENENKRGSSRRSNGSSNNSGWQCAIPDVIMDMIVSYCSLADRIRHMESVCHYWLSFLKLGHHSIGHVRHSGGIGNSWNSIDFGSLTSSSTATIFITTSSSGKNSNVNNGNMSDSNAYVGWSLINKWMSERFRLNKIRTLKRIFLSIMELESMMTTLPSLTCLEMVCEPPEVTTQAAFDENGTITKSFGVASSLPLYNHSALASTARTNLFNSSGILDRQETYDRRSPPCIELIWLHALTSLSINIIPSPNVTIYLPLMPSLTYLHVVADDRKTMIGFGAMPQLLSFRISAKVSTHAGNWLSDTTIMLIECSVC